MINDCNKLIRFSESERAMAEQFNLIVYSFESSIGDPEFGPGQKSTEMIFDQACKFNHGFQSRVSGPPEPLLEVSFSSFSLEGISKPLEFFFKVVGPDDGKILSLSKCESLRFSLGVRAQGFLSRMKRVFFRSITS